MALDDNMTNDIDGTTNWTERVHPELQPILQTIAPNMTFDSWWKAGLCSALMHIPGRVPPGVKVMKVRGIGDYYYPTNDENNEGCKKSSSAVMWIHGGGRIMGSASGAGESAVCSRIVKLLGVPVLSAHHRLAPRHPFPAALDDILNAYHWLARHVESESAGMNSTEMKIAVAGESAGSGLAAELCQRLLDESQEQNETAPSKLTVPLPVCQLLINPMLDDRTCVDDSLSKLPPHLVWNNKSNMYAWSSYLGPSHEPGDENLPKYASASRRNDLSGLPPAYIEVGDLDLFRTECIEYARRLKDDGVETEFVETKGAFHGFMSLGRDEQPIVESWERFQTFGKKFLLD
mmetsp:Transcript_2522/g.5355  ORF Transcript_2522/g.5355 Transcript_2522/m.5355 type:complete len:347 (+) Transcript_2522:241-1281(+)|eukprot:CAMPEP_0172318610 /NCGR_PEP_ID=MMETSP1058-20130122/35370_1 /TAXON_ID=83371 /ORGANISM="Detonula confervacea, Strain CCMP 353" /LENGTH=346 /DNA_ID=CAMNT_0013033485 /DNA_START=222 /DNA_END=1262 /DNA_ORIENTATION=+